MKNKFLLVFTLAAVMSFYAKVADAQGMAVSSSGSSADASAMLDVQSTSRGILIPRMTAAQRGAITSPATGLLVYQNDGATGFYFYDGTSWIQLSVPVGSAGGDLTGTYPSPTLITSGVTSGSYGSATQVPAFTVDAKGRLTAAGNTTITGVTPGGSAGGDLTGTYPNPTFTTSGVTSGSYGSATQVPVFTVDAKGRLTAAGNTTITGTTPGGSAGGDLTGTYPNPTLATSGVTAATYGSATTAPTITVDAKGRITAASSTTITGVTPGGSAGGDLTGTYPSPTLTTSGVTAASYGSATQVGTFTVDSKGRLTAAGNTTITGTTPGGSAGGDLTGTYPSPTVATGAITSGKILDGTIANVDISSTAAIDYSKLNLGSSIVPGDMNATGTASSTTFFRGDGTWSTPSNVPGGSAGGDLTGTYPSPTLATSGVTAASYGSATQVGTFTVDAKGRLTAAGNTTITGTTPGGSAGGDLTGTYPNPTLATTAVTAASYGSATQVGTFTVDAKGRLTAAGNTTITGTTPGGSAGGDLTGTYPNPTLAATAVTAASYGSATQVGTFTVDSKGRLTAAGNTTITGTTPGGSAGGDLTGTYPSPTIASGAITNAKVSATAAIDYSKLNLSSSIVPGDMNATGTASSTTFLRGDGSWSAPSSAPSGSAGGDLTGTYPNPTLATTAVTAASYGSATQVGTFTVDSKGRLTAAGNTTITGTTPGGSAGGDLTGTYPNPTLATTAVTAASYGSATQVGTFTVDSKGRLTAAGNTTITGTTPGGSAGGDLTGTYPSPTIASGAITNAKVSATAAIDYSKLNLTSSIVPGDMNATGTASSTTFLRGDGTWSAPSGGAPSGSAGGDLAGSYPNPTLATTAVTAASYGSATQVGTFTVDSKGRLTAAGNTTITGTTPGGTAGGDLTGTYPSPTIASGAITNAKVSATAAIDYSKLNLTGSVVPGDMNATGTASSTTFLRGDGTWSAPSGGAPSGSAGGDLAGTYPNPTLATTAVTAASYGSATQVGTFTVDSKGRLTAAGNTTITGTTPGGSAGGDLTGTYPSPTLATTAVTAASYGSATQVGTFTVDSKGRLTAAGNTTITGTTPGGSAGGDLAGSYPSPTLATTGVAAATYGSATNVPVITVDAKGRITAASATTITGTTPGGSASGDLTGTYPGPTLAATAVTAGSYGSSSNVPTYTVDAKGRLTAASNTAIGSLGAGVITSGTIATARLGSGTANSSTYLKGDQTWGTPQSIVWNASLGAPSTTQFCSISGGSTFATAALAGSPIPVACTIDAFYVYSYVRNSGTTAGNTVTGTIYVNGSATAVTVNVVVSGNPAVNTVQATVSDVSHTAAINAGDLVTIQWSDSNGGSGPLIQALYSVHAR
jgi:trimeric autotransporter adhesin